MRRIAPFGFLPAAVLAVVLMTTPVASAQHWTSFENNTRYLALGDSLSAGYGAFPATNGFVYLLYQGNVIDNINNTLLCNIGVPNATSQDVLEFQIPQADLFFSDTGAEYRKVITLTVGGNDMQKLIGTTDPQVVLGALQTFSINLGRILGYLSSFPQVRIYIANQYDPRLPIPGERDLIGLLNQTIIGVASQFPDSVTVVDVFNAFEGRSGLLLIEKRGAEAYQVHPTNAGYRVMARAFADAILASGN